MNNQAVDLGVQASVKVEIPAAWADATDEPVAEPKNMTPFVRDIVMPLDKQQGDKLPVSVFQKYGVLDGTWGERHFGLLQARRCDQGSGSGTPTPASSATAARCAARTRQSVPVLLTDEEKAGVPDSFRYRSGKGPSARTRRSTISACSFRRMTASAAACALTACPAKDAR